MAVIRSGGTPRGIDPADGNVCAVDAYRNKVGSTMAAGGQDVSIVAPHLETRVGKRMWAGRKGKGARRGSSFKRADTP